jgi:polygalacturonase
MLLCGILALAGPLSAAPAAGPAPTREWADVPALLARIRAPSFPARDFVVTAYGAKGDGASDSLPALRAAIDACHVAGGGRVVVPAGEWFLEGPVHLQSNVDLHLEAGATLRFSGRDESYLPLQLTRWEGTLLYNYSPLIYARGAENVAVTGAGVIDGNARATFGAWLRRQDQAVERSRRTNDAATPVEERRFGPGWFLRPGLLELYECRNVLVEGVTFRDSPFWVIHPIFCTNVTVRGATVDSLALNNDGCDPDSCTDVLIEDCTFHTGDDGIAIKAGRDSDAWRDGRPTENVVIRRCRFQSRINGLCIGSEMAAGVRHVFMEDCRVETGQSCIYFKSNRDRGGVIEDVRVRNITVDEAKAALIRFETNYHSYRGGHAPTAYRDFVIEGVTCARAENYMLFAEGLPELPIRDVLLRDITVGQAREPLFLRHAEAFRLENVRVGGQLLPASPAPTPADTPKLKISI